MMKSCLVAGVLLTLSLLPLGGCGQSGTRVKVLIGATLVAEPGARPITDSIIVIEGAKIRAAGERKDVPVPQASDRTDLSGKWIVPVSGSIAAAREPANLLVLDHAPNGVTPVSASDIGARLAGGEWQLPR